MPIDPVSIALTALSFLFPGAGSTNPPIRSAKINDAGQFKFELGNPRIVNQGSFRSETALLEQRLTDHITKGAPLPDQFYTGRQNTPYWRAIYDQVRDDVIAAREDFILAGAPEGFVPTPAPPVGEHVPGDDSDIGGGAGIPPDFFPLEFRPQFGGPHESPVGPEDYFVPRFVRAAHRSIPGGAFGFAHQTPAGQRQLVGGLRSSNGGVGGVRKRRRSASPRRRMASVPSRAVSRKPRPGTKAWMSYIRGLRRKK